MKMERHGSTEQHSGKQDVPVTGEEGEGGEEVTIILSLQQGEVLAKML